MNIRSVFPIKTKNMRLLKIKPFKQLDNWGVKAAMTESVPFNSEYHTMHLRDVIRRVKNMVDIKDDEIYESIKVKYYNGGVESRGQNFGKDIKSKRQFKVSTNQIVVSKIDARNGAIGIIPKELNDAIITNNFMVYEVDLTKALPKFIVLLLTSPMMMKKIADDSSGATRRIYLQENKFLSEPIALPSLAVQRTLVEEYDKKIVDATNVNDSLEKLSQKAKHDIEVKLKIHYCTNTLSRNILSSISLAELTRWDVGYYRQQSVLMSGFQLCSLRDCVDRLMVDEDGHGLRTNAENVVEGSLYIGMDSVEKGIGQANKKRFMDAREVKGEMTKVPKGYFIFGKLRPYLNKFWLNRNDEKSYTCSSEFVVFNLKEIISKEYFEAVLFGEIVKRQLETITSGARMPRIKEQDLMGVLIPIPSKRVQHEVTYIYSDYVNEKKKRERIVDDAHREARDNFDKELFNSLKS